MEWLESRRDLQIKMLERMRSLGMTPVLPAFAGHIPHAFQAKYPATKTSRSPDWANFDKGNPATAPYADVYLVEPVDPMFVELGNKFIEMQTLYYGTDHIYNCDTYNEMQPPTSDPAYLQAAAGGNQTSLLLDQNTCSRTHTDGNAPSPLMEYSISPRQ